MLFVDDLFYRLFAQLSHRAKPLYAGAFGAVYHHVGYILYAVGLEYARLAVVGHGVLDALGDVGDVLLAARSLVAYEDELYASAVRTDNIHDALHGTKTWCTLGVDECQAHMLLIRNIELLAELCVGYAVAEAYALGIGIDGYCHDEGEYREYISHCATRIIMRR